MRIIQHLLYPRIHSHGFQFRGLVQTLIPLTNVIDIFYSRTGSLSSSEVKFLSQTLSVLLSLFIRTAHSLSVQMLNQLSPSEDFLWFSSSTHVLGPTSPWMCSCASGCSPYSMRSTCALGCEFSRPLPLSLHVHSVVTHEPSGSYFLL